MLPYDLSYCQVADLENKFGKWQCQQYPVFWNGCIEESMVVTC